MTARARACRDGPTSISKWWARSRPQWRAGGWPRAQPDPALGPEQLPATWGSELLSRRSVPTGSRLFRYCYDVAERAVTARPTTPPPPTAHEPPMNRPAIALTIAGSDPSGGAGIQADLKTFSALGVYGAAVVTALTAQNTRTVTAVRGVAPGLVRAQIDAVLNDLPVDAIKLGMLHSAAIIDAVADALISVPQIPVVLDPVMLSKSGAPLLDAGALSSLRQRLIPRAAVLTPNLPEAAVLLGSAEADLLADVDQERARLASAAACATWVPGPWSSKADTSPRKSDQRRLVLGRQHPNAALRPTDRHAQHARHGLYLCGGDYLGPRPGRIHT